jgi:hypothetical protein
MARHAPIFHSLAEAEGFELRAEAPVPWLTRNGHLKAEVRDRLPAWAIDGLDRILDALDGDADRLANKTRGSMRADFLLMPQQIEVEYDEVQHFTGARLATLGLYPVETDLAFDVKEYASIVSRWRSAGERGFAHRTAAEFPGASGRARQRAYFDAFRDIAAPFFGNGPVLRVPAPDNDYAAAVDRLRRLVASTGV